MISSLLRRLDLVPSEVCPAGCDNAGRASSTYHLWLPITACVFQVANMLIALQRLPASRGDRSR
jgi:hypothetical protein